MADLLLFGLRPIVFALLLAVAYFAGLATYRLYLSPLSKIPRPKLAALTTWYEYYYDVFLPGQYVFKIKKLHEHYGPIIRITPDEVSFSDPGAVDIIYAPGPGHRRDKNPRDGQALGTSEGIGATIGHNHHRRRRAPLSSLFSRQSVLRDGSWLLNEKSDQLDAIFSRAAAAGEIVNLSDLYYGMTNDIVCQYSFGSNDNLLGDPARAGVLRNNLSALLRQTNFGKHFTWIQSILSLFPVEYAPPGVKDMVQYRQKIRQQIDTVIGDRTTKEDDGQLPSIIQIIHSDHKLPASEKSRKRLEDEAALTVMAGTESPATSLSIAHYHILANPAIMARLRKELGQRPTHTLEELDQLPYLDAVQMEAFRLDFGLAGRHAMLDPDKPITFTYSGVAHVIPAGTPMSVQTLVQHTNEDIFPDPWIFKPERWLGEEGAMRRKHLLSFNKGLRQCLGINLAKAELCIGLAVAARWDMSLYETDDSDVTFLHDYFVATPKLDSKVSDTGGDVKVGQVEHHVELASLRQPAEIGLYTECKIETMIYTTIKCLTPALVGLLWRSRDLLNF
ncbi:hypothetical protein NM208_g3131 [Fusarium decemcellulare]|uniref:Uncharacterized protein n=1 Tax=Fusarium decemcellulare TaxID=57161 RepID=A0ACC1SQB8_9HYPO|nr:hypothetical protein NM208_g3131 [Fusarium decemcellulare]